MKGLSYLFMSALIAAFPVTASAELDRLTALDDGVTPVIRIVNAISYDSRFVLVRDPDTSPKNIQYRLDTETGAIAPATAGDDGVAVPSLRADMSADGRYVAFVAVAPNVSYSGAQTSYTGGAVFLKDMQTGETTIVSRKPDGTVAQMSTEYLSFAPDARSFVVRVDDDYSDLYPADQDGNYDLVHVDIENAKATLITAGINGQDSDGVPVSPDVCAGGTWVAYAATSTNLTGDTVPGTHLQVFLTNVATGETRLLSKNGAGVAGNGASSGVAFSGDCDYVFFTSKSSNLGANETDGWEDIYRYSIYEDQLELVTADSNGHPLPRRARVHSKGGYASYDGRYVAFTSNHHKSNYGNNEGDVFVKDMETGTLLEVSTPTGAGESPSKSDGGNAMISFSGKEVVFVSADKLVEEDTNNNSDLYRYSNSVCN